MTENNLITRLRDFLDLGAKRRRKRADELEKLIRKFRKKEKAVIAECRKVGKGKKRKILDERRRILHAQRKKGEKALRKIRDNAKG